MTTKHRALQVATVAFADRGVAGTSLDGLAAELGVTKQTILYHFGSKGRLIEAVLAQAAEDLAEQLEAAVEDVEPGWPKVEAIVRASFGLAVRRPELLGVLRETSRLGSPWSESALDLLQPLIDRALHALETGIETGHFQAGDPRVVLVSAYAVVSGAVTDPELLRAVGLQLDLRTAAELRRTLLLFLRVALGVSQSDPLRNRHGQTVGAVPRHEE